MLRWITDNLAVSDMCSSRNEQVIEKEGITSVINVASEIPDTMDRARNARYFDPGTPYERDRMDRILRLMDTLIKHGEKVVVSCMEGIHRSPSVAACYLHYKGMDLIEAIRTVHSAKNDVEFDAMILEQCSDDREVHNGTVRERWSR